MYTRILIPIDLNESSSWAKALPTAVDYARRFGARLTVMTVVPDFGAGVVGSFFPADFKDRALAETRAALTDLCARFVSDDVDHDIVVKYGNIYEDIIEMSRTSGADLIILASHRPKLEDYLLGPNAARVVRHAGCSVLVVRP